MNKNTPVNMQSTPDSLREKLRAMTQELPPDGVTLATIRDLIGQEGMLVFIAFLTTIFMIPVSIPGVSTVFGSAILLISCSRLFGRNLWLPRRIAQHVLPSDKVRSGLDQGSIWLSRLEHISRPHRLNWLARPGLPDMVNNLGLILGAGLLMAPFGFVPFSNTFPALALLLLAIGLLQRDGVFILLGHLANLVTIIYFAFLLLGGGLVIREAYRYFIG